MNAMVQKSAQSESDPILKSYLSELRKIPLLDRSREKEIAQKARSGDHKARNILVEGHLRFVVSIARKYRVTGMTLMDLINEGNIGLVQAAERFNPDQGFHFTTYAVYAIKHAIFSAIRQKSGPVRLPLNQNSAASFDWVSLNSTLTGTEDYTLADIIADDGGFTPDVHHELSELHQEIHKSLNILGERERIVIESRFGMDGTTELSLEKTGEKVGVSKERVRQIEKLALSKIRGSRSRRRLEAFLN